MVRRMGKFIRASCLLLCLLILAGCGTGVPDTIDTPTVSVGKKGQITLWQVGTFDRDDYILSELQTFAEEEAARFNLSGGQGAVTVESVEALEDSPLVVVRYEFDGWESCTQFCGEIFFVGTVREAGLQGFSTGVALTGVKDGVPLPEGQMGQWPDRRLVITNMKTRIYCSGSVTHVSGGTVVNKDGSVDTSGVEGLAYILLK